MMYNAPNTNQAGTLSPYQNVKGHGHPEGQESIHITCLIKFEALAWHMCHVVQKQSLETTFFCQLLYFL